MNSKSIGLSMLVVLIWGISFSVIKLGLDELPPMLFSGLRFLIVAIPAVFIIPFPKTSIWNVLGVGLFLGLLKFSFLFIAMKEDASAGISSLILQAQVIFTIVLSILILKEKISKSRLVGLVFSCIGFSFFIVLENGSTTINGVLMLLLAAFFWSIANLIMQRMKGVNFFHFMVWVSLIPPIPLFILSFFLESRDPIDLLLSTSGKAWFSIAYVGYVSTLVAFVIWGWLLRNYPASVITPFALLVPIIGIISSSIILNERLTMIEILGSFIIIVGLCISVFGNHLNR